MKLIGTHKVFVSRDDVASFNRQWPCSELRSSRAYWFEFDEQGDLIDTDVPEHDDGRAASALCDDCHDYWLTGAVPRYASEE